MPPTHSNQLFSRDLKYLVDPKYSVAPNKRGAPMVSVAVVAGLLAGGTWLALSGPDSESQPPVKAEVVAEEATELAETQQESSDNERIAPQTETAEKTDDDAVIVVALADSADAIQGNSLPAEASTDNAPAEPAAVPEPHDKEIPVEWVDYKIKSGDSLARIFQKHDLSTRHAILIAEHEDAKDIRKLMPGQKLRIAYDQDRKFRALSVELRSHKKLLVGYEPDGSLRFSEVEAELNKHEKAASAIIESSLFKAGARVGLNDKLIMKLVTIYGWDIDFAKDLRKGDRFTVVYEELYQGKTSKGTGEIIAAEFHNQERKLFAFRHLSKEGLVEYFDEEGNNLRGTFLRTPMKISRITSGFSKSRFHPILKEWRAHKGVDYAAPRGTPILATADGRVSFLGRKNGYGKTVVLRHGGKYSTLYAHLSSYKSKLKPGSNVKQGQIVGFVGKTGMATAPHLHYEFRVHGTHRDPLSYESPKAAPVPAEDRNQFMANAERWMGVMARSNTIELAQNESSNQ